MKKLSLIIVGLLFVQTTFSNINSIDLSKVAFSSEIKDDLDFILENQSWFNHWSPQWDYDVPKKQCLKKLKSIFQVCGNKAKSYDDYLLKGVIAHFQYNLNDEKQFQFSVDAYYVAFQLAPMEYRAYWYLGNHYAHSGLADSSVKYFNRALLKNTKINNYEFWEEYAFAFHLAHMPSHCIRGMEKANEILGKPCYFESVLGETVRALLPTPDPSSTYEQQDIWSYQEDGSNSTFISRPLGLKFTVDSNWTMNFGKYENDMSYVIMKPNGETDKNGKSITYSIMIMAHVPDKGETIEIYANKFIGQYTNKRPNERYKSLNPKLSYVIEDSSMYPDLGGGHLQFMALLKEYPDNPGLELEAPSKLPGSKKKKLAFYRFNSSFSRFDGNLMYVVMLDTCEDIYEKSLKVYDTFLKSLIIE